jgi:hypothetical protein
MTVRKIDSEPVEPIDVMAVAGDAVAKRVAPLAIVAAVVALAILVLWRRS